MGPHLMSAAEGAVLDVVLPYGEAQAALVLGYWRDYVVELCQLLGWPSPETVVRRAEGETSCFVSAPIDRLMTATELAEQGWWLAEGRAGLRPVTAEQLVADRAAVVERLRQAAVLESTPRAHWPAVYAEATRRGITVTFDDDGCSVGSGAGSRSYAWSELPSATHFPWSAVHDVPVALVTGSNGKTTTTRLLAAIWRAAGRTPGLSSTEGVRIGEHLVTEGDWSGPAGARAVLRDPRVQAAVLETARGGILRRGLATRHADVSVITNISADHFGEYGIASVAELAQVKAVVAKALGPNGALVLTAEDDALRGVAEGFAAAGAAHTPRVVWASLDASHPVVAAARASGGTACAVRDGVVTWFEGETATPIVAAAAVPITINGTALHNVANVCSAVAAAMSMGVPVDAVRRAVTQFGAEPTDNPGRLTVLRVGGVTAVVDYAHNPAGLFALGRVASGLGGARRLLVLGQAGNRDNEAVRALVRAAVSVGPWDRVIVKDLPRFRRGRAVGELTTVIADELRRCGVAESSMEIADDEVAAVRAALAWGRAGDLLVLPLHEQASGLVGWMGQLSAAGWMAGEGLPG